MCRMHEKMILVTFRDLHDLILTLTRTKYDTYAQWVSSIAL